MNGAGDHERTGQRRAQLRAFVDGDHYLRKRALERTSLDHLIGACATRDPSPPKRERESSHMTGIDVHEQPLTSSPSNDDTIASLVSKPFHLDDMYDVPVGIAADRGAKLSQEVRTPLFLPLYPSQQVNSLSICCFLSLCGCQMYFAAQ